MKKLFYLILSISILSSCKKDEIVQSAISQQENSTITINPNIASYLLNNGIKGTINNYGTTSVFVGFSPVFGRLLTPGSILVYKSWDEKYAKIKILEYTSGRDVKIQWVCYNSNGTIRSQKTYICEGSLYGFYIAHEDMQGLMWQGNTGYWNADYGGLIAVYNGPYSFENLKL